MALREGVGIRASRYQGCGVQTDTDTQTHRHGFHAGVMGKVACLEFELFLWGSICVPDDPDDASQLDVL